MLYRHHNSPKKRSSFRMLHRHRKSNSYSASAYGQRAHQAELHQQQQQQQQQHMLDPVDPPSSIELKIPKDVVLATESSSDSFD